MANKYDNSKNFNNYELIISKFQKQIDMLTAENEALKEEVKKLREALGRPVKITENDKKEILQLREKGLSIRKIAMMKNISIGSVHNIIKSCQDNKGN